MRSTRWDTIVDYVRSQGSVTVEQISGLLNVSPATVRRDLANIEENGLIRRTRGGAARPMKVAWDRTIEESRVINAKEKELIGAAAARLIKPGETVMIDGGFTTSQVAKHLDTDNISIVTNSFDVAQALLGRPGVTLVIVGGELKASSGTTTGPIMHKQIRQLCADKAILGVNAISPIDGLSTPSQLIAQAKQAMIERSSEIIAVADHSKLGATALYRIAPIESITTLVTDDLADADILDAFRSAGVNVIVVEEDNDK